MTLQVAPKRAGGRGRVRVERERLDMTATTQSDVSSFYVNLVVCTTSSQYPAAAGFLIELYVTRQKSPAGTMFPGETIRAADPTSELQFACSATKEAGAQRHLVWIIRCGFAPARGASVPDGAAAGHCGGLPARAAVDRSGRLLPAACHELSRYRVRFLTIAWALDSGWRILARRERL
ncbi:hypothetical protein [Burkholderia gladioli]|uniref:hypothetical protein n=1 Tax=Burkholderia gladioli TaxID=28095 RepID=UPI00163EFDCC|nr:hypothetical protein [Burkholderia gladioli]